MADGAQFALIMWDELLGQLLSIQSNTSEDNDSNGNIWEDDRYKNKVRQYKNTLPGQIIGPGPLLSLSSATTGSIGPLPRPFWYRRLHRDLWRNG